MSDWKLEDTARTVRRTRPSSRPPASGAFQFELLVLEGADAGLTYAIDPARGSVLIGSSALSSLRLADDEVAPRQCTLELQNDRVRVLDLSPEKTTRVNGVFAHEAYLVGGEVIRVGATLLAVRRTERRSSSAPPRSSFGRVIGESPAMTTLYSVFAHLAHQTAPILIAGERGTGKRLLAEELHAHGAFRTGPFVVIPRRHPRAVTATLLESARGGTLYVEEAADLDVATLLHVLGLTDARVILATRGDRPLAVTMRRAVTLPPLRERPTDVAVLARRIWTELEGPGSLPDDFAARFDEYAWPGNVRELRIAVRDRILHATDEATTSDVYDVVTAPARGSSAPPDAMNEVIDSALPFAKAREEVLAEFERRYVDRALQRSGNNVGQAAANSGIAHRYFQVLKSRRKTA